MMLLKRFYFSLLFILFAIVPFTVSGQEIDCLKCHAKLKKDKTVHPALEMGCSACHSALDARTVPHKRTGSISRGLSAEQPELCYGCHDKALFAKKTVHPALGMGCTACHNPHSSKYAKLLIADLPDLCFTCHDKSTFTKKVVHPPVAAGMCLSCHTPHASDQPRLLQKKPYELCLDCHADITKSRHAISGFGAGSHPLGAPRKGRHGEAQEVMDPARPGRTFYCGSCHDPHSSDVNRLFRFNVRSSMELCINCHTK